MYTRCQACHTVHPINAELLSRAAGQYRCGKCKKLSNALDALFDEWPSAGETVVNSRPDTQAPVLGGSLALEIEEEGELTPEEAALLTRHDSDRNPDSQARKTWLRATWISTGIMVVLIASYSVSSYFGVFSFDHPAVEQSLVRIGLKDAPPQQPFRDSESIEIVSRELLSHPMRPKVLLLNATIVNRASQAQPYPDIDVRLFDLNNEVISERRYRPTDYLTSSAELRSGMTPGAYLRFSLEMLDPADRAVGFELEFH